MRTKVILLMILVVFFTIFISQNAEELPVKILFWEVQIPGIILILLTGLLGIIIGFILALIFRKSGSKKEIKKDTSKDMQNMPPKL